MKKLIFAAMILMIMTAIPAEAKTIIRNTSTGTVVTNRVVTIANTGGNTVGEGGSIITGDAVARTFRFTIVNFRVYK